MKTFVGVDYHKKFSYGAVMNEAGDILKQGRFSNTAESVAGFLEGYGGADCSAVLEATRNWCVMHDLLEAAAGEVMLAHPLKVRAIAEARIKTDKIDATTLAHLLRCDLVPRAHVSSPEARIVKNLLRHRMFLVVVRTMVKNRIHALIDRFPVLRTDWPQDALFGAPGIRWLKGAALPSSDRRIMDGELELLEHLAGQVKSIDAVLSKMGKEDRRVELLASIPGIGKYLAMVVVSEIDDIARFRTPGKLHAYAGIIPSTYASGSKAFHGRITKTGNKYLRWALVEAVWPAIRSDLGLRRRYDQIAKRKGANAAKVALARRLLTIVYRVWKENREYRDER